MARGTVILVVAFAAVLAGGAAYAAGVSVGRAAAGATPAPVVAQPVQSPDPFQPPSIPQFPQPFPMTPSQPAPGQPPTLREFIPIPGPGDRMPGQQPGQENGECEPIILFYHNGQLYQLQPGPGQQFGPGRPGTPPEFYQLNPYQGPAIPGLPAPQPRPDRGPGFSPVNPRS
jgi:hypothetical protein